MGSSGAGRARSKAAAGAAPRQHGELCFRWGEGRELSVKGLALGGFVPTFSVKAMQAEVAYEEEARWTQGQ